MTGEQIFSVDLSDLWELTLISDLELTSRENSPEYSKGLGFGKEEEWVVTEGSWEVEVELTTTGVGQGFGVSHGMG